MKIENTFAIPLPVADAWKTLIDVESLVPCVPGAALIEKSDDLTYKGKISVRLGPVSLTFKGDAKFKELDEHSYRALMTAKGADANGRGGANANVTFYLEPDEDDKRTTVRIETDLKLSGSIAQYGRGGTMISDLASMLTKQFADNLHQKLSQNHANTEDAIPVVTEPAKPISGLTLGFQVLWNSIYRTFGRIFSRT